ncbi:MAG: hypothetical protein P4L99_07930, partial [Chthoniobacter sp.]|nr:hypothetical protein [Chthoniobacter sp.]
MMSAPASASYPAGEFDCDGDDFSDSGSSSVTSSSTSKPLGAKAYLTDCRFGSRCNRGEQV